MENTKEKETASKATVEAKPEQEAAKNEPKYKQYNMNKKDLDFSKITIIEKLDPNNKEPSSYNFKSAILMKVPSNSDRAVGLNSEVNYNIRKYVCIGDKLLIYNKIDYHADRSSKINAMKQVEAQIRNALLLQKDNQQYFYIYRVEDKQTDPEYISAKTKFLKEEDFSKSDGYIYFDITINYVTSYTSAPTPKEPSELEGIMNICVQELRYFCNKKMFNKAVRWANDSITKILVPEGTGAILNKNVKSLSDNEIKKVLNAFKPILMNKSFALLKQDIRQRDNNEIIKTVDLFLELYKEPNDAFLKMSLRKVEVLLEKKEYDKCIYIIDDLKILKNKFSKENVGEIDEWLKKAQAGRSLVNSKENNFNRNFLKNLTKSGGNDEEEYKWLPVTTTLDEKVGCEFNSHYLYFQQNNVFNY